MKPGIFLLIITVFFSFLIPLGLSCSEQKKEFTIWIGGAPQEMAFWEDVIKEFEESSGISVELVHQPAYTDQRRQALVISLHAKQPNPDLFLMDVVWVKQFAESDWLLPLDSFIEKDNFDVEVFFEQIIKQVNRHNGKIYSLPVFPDIALLYYRKDLLEKYGYKSHPKTWEELLDISQDIQHKEREKGNSINGFLWQGAQYEGMVCCFNEFISSNNGSIINGNKYNLTQQNNIDALNFMQQLIHKYEVSPLNTFTEMKEEEVRRNFQQGNAVFQRNWTYAWALHNRDESPVRGKVGVTALPHFKNGRSASTLGGWHVGLSKYSDTKEEAWELIKFITSYKVQKKMIMTIGWNPARKDVYDDEEVRKENPHTDVLKEVLETAVARPSISYYPQLSEVIQRFVNNSLAGRMIPEEALKKIQTEAEKLAELYSE